MADSSADSSADLCPRDSYSHRICDDLSEVILQFLPIKDKVRLECVSKRFRRTIFAKQNDLQLSDFDNLRSWQSLFKKCSNLVSIDLNQRNDSDFINNILDLVFINFQEPILFRFSAFDLSPEIVRRVVEKYGTKAVISLRYNPNLNCLNSLVDIKEIDCNFYSLTSKELIECKFNNLRKLWIYFWDNEYDFQTFVDHNKSLTHLYVSVFISDEKAVQKTLKAIPSLKNLIHLQIWTEMSLNLKCFESSLKRIAVNCVHLKSIECHLRIDSKNASNPRHLLSSLESFERLKRLNLFISYANDFDIPNTKIFSFDSFKMFGRLTHLTLKFLYLRYDINDSVLQNIDKTLPRLQYFRLPNNLNVTEDIAHIFGRLSRLETIKIKITDNSIREFFEALLKSKCPKIRTIDLNFDAYKRL